MYQLARVTTPRAAWPSSRLILLGVLLCMACRMRPANVYEIPEDFRGWVRIEFGIDGCPSLEAEGDRRILIPTTGRLCTSSAIERGWARDEFYLVGRTRTRVYENDPPERRLIWGRSVGTDSRANAAPKVYMMFFVGTQRDVAAAGARP